MERASRTIERVLSEHVTLFKKEPKVVASAPGRLDFLNTHQDYKGLPVVSVAIDRRTYISLSSEHGKVRVVSLNLCEEGTECVDEFDTGNPVLRGGKFFGDYVRSVVVALKERGFRIGGFNALIYSEVPVASGLASSAALQVALITGLNELYGLGLEKQEIAELAYHSEHDIMGIPCGRLDQYGSTMGGITAIMTRPPYTTRTYPGFSWTFVVLDSGIKHSTAEVHPRRIAEIERGLRALIQNPELPQQVKSKLFHKIDQVLWDQLDLGDLHPYIEQLDETSRKRILFTLKMNFSTKLALDLLDDPQSIKGRVALEEFLRNECPECLEPARSVDDHVLRLISGVVNYQHVLLRDLYEVSLPELELIRERAILAGALAVKISGAGLGGSLLAIARNEKEAGEVVRAVEGLARAGWVVKVGMGARVDYSVLR